MSCLVLTSGVPRHCSNPGLSQGVENRAAPPSHPKERLNSVLFHWVHFDCWLPGPQFLHEWGLQMSGAELSRAPSLVED